MVTARRELSASDPTGLGATRRALLDHAHASHHAPASRERAGSASWAVLLVEMDHDCGVGSPLVWSVGGGCFILPLCGHFTL